MVKCGETKDEKSGKEGGTLFLVDETSFNCQNPFHLVISFPLLYTFFTRKNAK